MTGRTWLALLALLPALGACRRAAFPGTARVVALPELSAGLPDAPGRRSAWALEREPALSAVLIDPKDGREGMRLNPHSRLRLFILAGSLRVRVGPEERVLGAGAFASVPRGMLRRVSPEGAGRTLYLRLVAPDIDRDVVLERAP